MIQDGDGAFWLASDGLYAVTNEAGGASRVLDAPRGVASLFLDTRGRAYASLWDGTLMALSRNTIPKAWMVRAPLKLPAKLGKAGDDGTISGDGTDTLFPLAIGAIAPDESMWSSDLTCVVHVRRDGSAHVIRLARPITEITRLNIPSIEFSMAPDGSVWLRGPVHITTNDTVEVITGLPKQNEYPLSVGDDGSVWYVAADSQQVIHFRLPPSSKI